MSQSVGTSPPRSSGFIDLRSYQELLGRVQALEQRMTALIEPKLQFQVGLTVVAFPTGFGFTEVALTKPWTKRHVLFLPSLHPELENGCWLTNWGPYNSKSEANLGAAFVEVNNPKAQNIALYWVSIGE